jgi:dihydropyrimidinase
MGLLIRNAGRVDRQGVAPGNVYMAGGRIVSLEADPDPHLEEGRIIDASGMLVFPGGVDPHVHLQLPTQAGFSSDDFESGSRAALFGGTTTLLDFVTPRRDQTLIDALTKRLEEAGRSMTDYALHVSPVAWRISLPLEIENCLRAGANSFKVYMAYQDTIGVDDEVLEKVMRAVGKAGGMVLVHAEDGPEIARLRDRLFRDGHTGPSAHPLSRPPGTESRAVGKVIGLAARTNCPLYIVHVSAAESVRLIRQARNDGQEVHAEACIHHLLLDESLYSGAFEAAAPFVLSPPLRGEADRDALWEGLADGTIEVVSTDHCPFFMHQKARGRDDFRRIANGAGGVEFRLSLLYTHGVLAGRISLPRFVDAVSEAPARLFGLSPRKGSLKAGADADLVVWNPEAEQLVSAATQHQRCDHTIYEGLVLKGAPEYVIAGGEVVIEKGEMVRSRTGSYLARDYKE